MLVRSLFDGNLRLFRPLVWHVRCHLQVGDCYERLASDTWRLRPHERPGWGWIFFGFVAMAVVLLWSEHRAHILGVIPYLILFACPLMHLLHRHGHREHRDHEEGHHA